MLFFKKKNLCWVCILNPCPPLWEPLDYHFHTGKGRLEYSSKQIGNPLDSSYTVTGVDLTHPGLHRGLFDDVLQPLLMVTGGLRTTALLLSLSLHWEDTANQKTFTLLTNAATSFCAHPPRLSGEASPLQGFSAASSALLSSSSPAPSLCWWFVWPDTSAGDGGAAQETSPPPQHACTHRHTHTATVECTQSYSNIRKQ